MKIRYSRVLLSVALLFSSAAHSMSIPHNISKIKLEDIKDNAIGGLATVTVLLAGSVLYLMKQVSNLNKKIVTSSTPGNPNEPTLSGLQQELRAVKASLGSAATNGKSVVERLESVEVESRNTLLLLSGEGAVGQRIKTVEDGLARRNSLDAINGAQDLGASVSALKDTAVTKAMLPKLVAELLTDKLPEQLITQAVATAVPKLVDKYLGTRFEEHANAIKYVAETQKYLVNVIQTNHTRLIVNDAGVLSLNHDQDAAAYDRAMTALKDRIKQSESLL